MSASHTSRYAASCALAAVAVVAAYSNHFRNDFHFDDAHTIQNNAFIRDVRNIPQYFRDPGTFSSLPSNQSYRPLVTTTLAIDYRIGGGLSPFAFHVTNFLLFALQSAALLVLFKRIMDLARPHPSNRWLALFAASWYALHTANAETVNYIIARSDILSTLGAVLALLMFSSAGRARRWHLYLIPAAAGVLAKEQAAMTAPLIFMYSGLFEHRLNLAQMARPRNMLAILRGTWPIFAVCGSLVLLATRLASSFVPGGASRWHYLLTQPFVITHYALSFFLPVNLSADTDWTPITNPLDDRVIIGTAVVLLLIWIAVKASRRTETRPIAFGILWFFLALVPTSSLIPLAEVMNDHRMYFPFVGAALAVTWAAGLALAGSPAAAGSRWRRNAVAAVAIAILAANAYGVRIRNEVWRTEESLWLDVTRKSPQNGRGLMTYGVIQMGKGNYDAAEQYFLKALTYAPQYSYLHVNLGVLHGARGRIAEAERSFLEGQRFDPGNPVVYRYYGRWLASVGRVNEARAQLDTALKLSPADAESSRLLAEVNAAAAKPPGTPDSVAASVPETPERWLELSLAQYRAGRFEECIESSRRALALRPDYAEAHNNICAAANALKRFGEAAASCERALAIRPDFPLARNNLAAARAGLGR